MQSTGVLLVLGAIVMIGLGIVTGSATLSAIEDGRGLSVSAAWGLAAIAATLTLMWLSIRRLRALVRVAKRLAEGELGVTIPKPGHDLLGQLERSVNAVSSKLTETHSAATTDLLTQVSNRGTILSSLFTEVDRAVRHERPLSVAFVDLDHFKAINDTHGHQVGDDVLRGVASLFQRNLRQTDVVGRYGGEEFMVVLPETGPEAAAEVAEKLRLLVQRLRFAAADGQTVGVTISIGIAGGQGRSLRAESLVRDADQAMYSAKSLGRNQTYVFAEPNDDARVPSAPISAAGRACAQEVAAVARQAAESALSDIIAPLPHYRGKPSVLIATIGVAMATDLGLPPNEIERIRIAALLHDIGKIAVPPQILEKPSALSTSEWDFVKQHPRIGQVILDEAGGLLEAGKIILHHHERFGGHGYPHGLRGRDIPLGSRIVSIADAYDAMIQDRPYKRAVDHGDAVAELHRFAGTQFDPELVDLFTRLFAQRPPVANLALLGRPGARTARARAADRRASA
ncbi:MAG TPA: diguanylate cyclase [Candidatus Limnocylindrales bacterium]|nr:diguanylate cyclase [Candidatus Limnocylindrales bacterium]